MRILSFDIGIRNLAYCTIEFPPETEIENGGAHAICGQYIEEWNIIDLGNNKQMETLAQKLLCVLHEQFLDFDADVVLIENQPVMKNPTMKSVQMIIYTFFMIQSELGLCSKDLKVRFISASVKNKLATDILRSATEGKYKDNKQRSVLATKHLIAGTSAESTLDKFKKQDDIADAFLQAVAYKNRR